MPHETRVHFKPPNLTARVWIAEFKVWHAGSVILELTRKYDATAVGYYLGLFQERGRASFIRGTVIYGPEAEKVKSKLHTDPRVRVLGEEAGQAFYSAAVKEAFHAAVFDRSVFFTKPIFVTKGSEYWTVAALRKQDLLSLYERIRALGSQRATIKLLSIKEKPQHVFLSSILSELTDTQRKVLQTAVENGYYEHPRKAYLEDLAKKVGMPRSTFQHHLREAERKALPALVEQTTFPFASKP